MCGVYCELGFCGIGTGALGGCELIADTGCVLSSVLVCASCGCEE